MEPTEAAVKRVRVFNLLIFASLLVLILNFKLSEVITFTAQIDHASNSYRSNTVHHEFWVSDVLNGNIPSIYLEQENIYPPSVYRYAAIALLLAVITGIIGLIFKGRRPVYIAIISLLILYVGYLNIEALASYYAQHTIAGGDLILSEERMMSPTTEIIRVLINVSLLFNLLHTPLSGWLSRKISSLSRIIGERIRLRSADN